jgi:hypothetical protein
MTKAKHTTLSLIILFCALFCLAPQKAESYFDSMQDFVQQQAENENVLTYDNIFSFSPKINYLKTVFSGEMFSRCMTPFTEKTNKNYLAFPYLELNTVYIPPIMSECYLKCRDDYTGGICDQGRSYAAKARTTAAIRAGVYGSVAAVSGGLGYIAMAAALFGEAAVLLELCNNYFVMQPHEMLYIHNDIFLKKKDTTYQWDDTNGDDGVETYGITNLERLGRTKVPYYFNCDATWDPMLGQDICKDGKHCSLQNRPWGYAGNTEMCAEGRKDAMDKVLSYLKDEGVFKKWDISDDGVSGNVSNLDNPAALVGAVVVKSTNGYKRHWGYKYATTTFNTDPNGGSSYDGGQYRQWGTHVIRPGFSENIGAFKVTAFYRHNQQNKVEVCAVALGSIAPHIIGCTPVAPPADIMVSDAFLDEFSRNTRCSFFPYGRIDLKVLGKTLAGMEVTGLEHVQPVSDDGVINPVIKFLLSDWHIFSTVTGCMSDLAQKIFVEPDQLNPSKEGMYVYVSKKWQNIVFVILTLYIISIGLKLMAPGQQPLRPGQIVMFALKFALVVFFTSPAAWYNAPETPQEKPSGLFPAILETANVVAETFVHAQSYNDMLAACTYYLDEEEETPSASADSGYISSRKMLLGNNEIPIPAVNHDQVNEQELVCLKDGYVCHNFEFGNAREMYCMEEFHNCVTQGGLECESLKYTSNSRCDQSYTYNNPMRHAGITNTVKLSVWDYVDCKFASYLNWGTCDFGDAGMMSLYATTYLLFSIPSKGFFLGIAMPVMFFMMIFIFMEYAYVFVVSLLVLSILVLMSPLIIPMSLFESTKGMFQQWFKMLLAYALYPGVFMAFLAFFMMTYDSIYVGRLNPTNTDLTPDSVRAMSEAGTTLEKLLATLGSEDPAQAGQILNQSCNENDTLYCGMVKMIAEAHADKQDQNLFLAPCYTPFKTYKHKLIAQKDMMGLFTIKYFPTEFTNKVWLGLLKLFIVTILFYIMTSNISSMIAVLFGAQPIHMGGRSFFLDPIITGMGMIQKVLQRNR